ncbi:MarR family winged helix-turn-helix transcriptional regulator [Polymorphospora sp. NPDC050346]|uniref:MarR family winged helix-turn-helix transcriptional regulator n=1 Tax=Polymorphospora sp. NPDC050346 TaxID=3155780 RepID=UPI0033FB3478
MMTSRVALLVEAAGHLRRTGEAIAAAEGQTQARWQVLSVTSDRPMTVSQAARRLGVTRQAVQRVANELVEEGLLAPEPNRDHRTSPLLRLTAAGKEKLDRLTERAEVFHEQITSALGPDQAGQAADALHTLLGVLRQREDGRSGR